MVVNKKGEIIVAEDYAHRISIYSHAGEKLRSLGSKGSGQGEFNGPFNVAVDDDGNILVADSLNHRIQKFSADGKFITAVGSRGNNTLQFDLPTGIAIHPVNKTIYVSERNNNRVQILNPDLTSHSIFNITSKGQPVKPRSIAFDRSTCNVYVIEERSNSLIQVLTESGNHLQWLGENKLNHPREITIDSNNTIYVCDTNNHQICILDCNGKLLQSFGTEGGQPGQFSYPRGLAVDQNGLIYVGDSSNNRIQIF